MRDPAGVTAPGWAVLGGGLGGAFLALLRERPTLDIDPGIFMSIFGGLLDGKKLYAELFDTKDPLFFYTGSLATWLFGPRGLFILDALLLIAAAVLASLIARERGLSSVSVVATGLIAAGLLTNPVTYVSGMTQLFAMTMLLGAVFAGLRQRWVVGGVLAALAVGLKLPMAVFLPALLLFSLAIGGTRRTLNALWGFLATAVAIVFIVGLRGEWSGYWASIELNFGYTEKALDVFGLSPAPRGTASFVFQQIQEPELLVPVLWTVAAAVVAVVVIVGDGRTQGVRGAARDHPIAVLALGIFASTSVYLLASAFFEHHLQVFALAGLFGALVLFEEVHVDATPSWLLPGLLALIALWGVPSDIADLDELASRWRPLDSEVAAVVERALEDRSPDETISYAVAGETAEEGVGWFLGDGYDFACRYVLQQPWFSETGYREHLDCIAAEPDVVIEMEPEDVYVQGSATYARYWSDLAALLGSEFEMVGTGANRQGYIRVWARTGG